MNKKFFLLSLFLCSLLNANEVLNKTQKDVLETKKDIVKRSETIDKYNWVSDINLSFSSSKDESNEKANSFSASLEQDIFRFGGIFYTIDLAKVQKEYDLLNVDVTYEEYLNTIYTTVLNLKIVDYQIVQTKLKIENQIIAVDIKKDEYKSGELGISDLNDAIIEKNSLQESLIEYEKTKENYVSSLKEYSSIDYKKIQIPTFNTITEENYLKSSKEIKLAKLNTKVKELDHQIEKTNYLPNVSLTSSYNHDYELENEGYNYGVKVSMPISFLSAYKKQKTKLEYLLAKKEQKQTLLKKELKYKQLLTNINSYKRNKQVALEDIKLYDELLETVESEYEAGYKAFEDVKTLKNTKKVREIDYKIDELNIQAQLVSLYFDS